MNVFKKVSITLISVLAFCVVGYLALVAVYCIPTGDGSSINLHMQQGITHFENETHNYNFKEAPNSEVDLYTDAICLLEASDSGTGNPFKDSVLNVYKDIDPMEHPVISLLMQYGNENTNFDIQKQNYEQRQNALKNMGDSNIPEFNLDNCEIKDYVYGRYWHGYLIILKPLLSLFDYGTIRTIMMFVLFALMIFLFLEVYKKFKAPSISVFILFIFLNPVSLSLCFLYFPLTLLTLVLGILVVRYNNFFLKEKFMASIVFLLFGCAMYFFDLFTFPIMGFLVPIALLVYSVFIKYSDQGKCLKMCCLIILRYGAFWVIGFLSLLGLKLLILFMVAVPDEFAVAMNKIDTWTSTSMVGYLNSIRLIFAAGLQPLVTVATLMIVICTIYLIIKQKKLYWGTLVVTLILAIAPIFFILVFSQHETFHLHFTFRDYAVSWLAIINYCCFYYTMYCKENKITNLKDI